MSDAVIIEGGLFAADLLENLGAAPEDVSGQRAGDFGLAPGARLTDEIQDVFSQIRSQWQRFERRKVAASDVTTRVTREAWMMPVMALLGFDLSFQRSHLRAGGNTYPISHIDGTADETDGATIPVHITAFDDDLDKRGYDRKFSPHGLVQDYLNRADALWGIVTNGRRIRILRDTTRLSRPVYIEFDLEGIVMGDAYAEFAKLYRLIHRSRFPKDGQDPAQCRLEAWYNEGVEQGGRVRERLRDGVEQALRLMGQGFIDHPQSIDLRQRLETGRLDPVDYYRQLLRLVYRLLFLMVAEERRLLFPEGGDDTAIVRQRLYTQWYSIERLRERAAGRRSRDPHADLWQGLCQNFRVFAEADAASELGVGVLDGELFGFNACSMLIGAHIRNDRLLEAIFGLSTFEDKEGRSKRRKGQRRRVAFAALDVEELGSVYETLLDFHPQIDIPSEPKGAWRFDLISGSERKTTGSYYTPKELVAELIKSALVPVLVERIAKADGAEAKARAILAMRVIDPAAGSGHFLLAAARRMGRELARIRVGENEPGPSEVRQAVRDVIRHCIYAVDKNPLAVDLCKVALWIESHTAGLPLSFLDHHIRCGDALVGVFDLTTLAEGIPDAAYKALTGDDKEVAKELARRNRTERKDKLAQYREGLGIAEFAQRMAKLDAMPEKTLADIADKTVRFRQLHEGDPAWTRLKTACDLYCSAFFMPKHSADIPTSRHLREALAGTLSSRHEANVTVVADEQRFFHWPLEFPEALNAGGFDIVLGNPPWDTMSPDYKEFFSVYDRNVRFMSPEEQEIAYARLQQDPAIANRWDSYCRNLYASVHFIKTSGRYRLFAPGNLGKGDFNIYRMFVETALTATCAEGVAAQFVPEGLYNGANATAIRKELFENFRLTKLGGFENTKEVWFKRVDSRTKFTLYVARKGGSTERLAAAFRINTLDRLQAFASSQMLSIPVTVVREFSPDAMAIMEFSAQSEVDVCTKMYERYPKFGEQIKGLPYRHYMREVDMGTDRELFSAGDEGLPVFEGRMIDAYDYRAKGYVSGRGRSAVWEDYPFGSAAKRIQPQWRIAPTGIPDKLGGRTKRYRIGFGDVASPTNQRGLIAALLPGKSVCGHTVPTIEFIDQDPAFIMLWLGIANSFAMDFLVRLKVSLHMSYTVMDSLPFPRDFRACPAASSISTRSSALCAVGPEMDAYRETAVRSGLLSSKDEVIDDPEQRAVIAAEIDALVAGEVFGLTKNEMLYILDPANALGEDCGVETFKALRNREKREFGEFRTQRLVLDAWDRFLADGTFNLTRINDPSTYELVKQRLAKQEKLVAKVKATSGPVLFVEGASDIPVIEAAWRVFGGGAPLPVEIKPAGGTEQLKSLAAKGKALKELLGDRVVLALADNDGAGRGIAPDKRAKLGGRFVPIDNGVRWALLKPSDAFKAAMARHKVPEPYWPCTIEQMFVAEVRREARKAGCYGFAAEPPVDLVADQALAKRMFGVLTGLAEDDDAYYLKAPHPDTKLDFARWITAPERTNPQVYAAFEPLIAALKEALAEAGAG